MSTKYTVRVASPVAYEYWEAEADTFQELLSAEQELRELKAEAGSTGAAVETVKKAFGKTTEVQPTSGGFGNKGRQEAEPEAVKLGEHDGYTIEARKSKFGGVYFNAYNGASKDRINANGPKGMKVSEATLQDAIDALSAA